VYLARPDSHNRRPDSSGETCVRQALKELSALGLYNNVRRWDWPQKFQFDLRKDFLVMSTCVNILDTKIQNKSASKFIKWLISNEHSVFCHANDRDVHRLMLTTDSTYGVSNVPTQMKSFDFLLCMSSSERDNKLHHTTQARAERVQMGIANFGSHESKTCEVFLLFAHTSTLSCDENAICIGETPDDWIRSEELMQILHPLLTGYRIR
jgi:hypothetical protein